MYCVHVNPSGARRVTRSAGSRMYNIFHFKQKAKQQSQHQLPRHSLLKESPRQRRGGVHERTYHVRILIRNERREAQKKCETRVGTASTKAEPTSSADVHSS